EKKCQLFFRKFEMLEGDAPGLIIDPRDCRTRKSAIETRWTSQPRAYLLHVFRKIENGITTRRPFRHLKVQRFCVRVIPEFDFDGDFEQVRHRARHFQMISYR